VRNLSVFVTCGPFLYLARGIRTPVWSAERRAAVATARAQHSAAILIGEGRTAPLLVSRFLSAYSGVDDQSSLKLCQLCPADEFLVVAILDLLCVRVTQRDELLLDRHLFRLLDSRSGFQDAQQVIAVVV
jgi:hypothetical protein